MNTLFDTLMEHHAALRPAWRRPGTRLALLWIGGLALGSFAFMGAGLDLDAAAASAGPSSTHPWGTDHLGRDVLARTFAATSAWAGPAVAAVAVALALGLPTGSAAGWSGGLAANVAHAVARATSSVPPLFWVLAASATHGADRAVLAFAVGVTAAPSVAELVVAHLARQRAEGSLDAALAHGLSPWAALIYGTWVGSAARPLAQLATRLVAQVLVIEATLSYVGGGLGLPQPAPSPGNLIAFDWGYPVSWVATAAPILTLAFTLVALDAVANALADAHD